MLDGSFSWYVEHEDERVFRSNRPGGGSGGFEYNPQKYVALFLHLGKRILIAGV